MVWGTGLGGDGAYLLVEGLVGEGGMGGGDLEEYVKERRRWESKGSFNFSLSLSLVNDPSTPRSSPLFFTLIHTLLLDSPSR